MVDTFKHKPKIDKEKCFSSFKMEENNKYQNRSSHFDGHSDIIKHENRLGYKSYWETEKGIGWDLRNGYSKSVRIDAAEKLGRIKTDEALNELIEAIGEKDEDVRAAILKAIELIGNEKAAKKLLQKVFGFLNETEEINKIIEKLKKGKEDEKRTLLMALKFDDKLRERVGKMVDNDIARSLWCMGEVAFPLIAEVAKDKNKREILSNALADSSEEIINEAIRSDEESVSGMAIEVAAKKGNYKFIPALTDIIVKKSNWQNAARALLEIEKKIKL